MRQRLTSLEQNKSHGLKQLVCDRKLECSAWCVLGLQIPDEQWSARTICICTGGRIGLIDYGQSKQLPDHERLAFAALILELSHGRGKVSTLVV